MRAAFALQLSAGLPLIADTCAAASRSVFDAVDAALTGSAEIARAREAVALAALEEPGLLANTDPSVFGAASQSEDWSPTPVPPIMGTRTIESRYAAGLRQKWLTGTQVQLALQGTRTDSDAAFRLVNPTFADRLQFNLRQPLLKNFFGRPDRALRRKARGNLVSAQALYSRKSQELALRVCEAYVELLFAAEDLRIKEESRDDLSRLLKRQLEKKSYGIAEETDVLQTQAALRLADWKVQAARIQAGSARLKLLTLLSNPDGWSDFETVKETPEIPEPEPFDQLYAQALERRDDLKAQRAKVEALEAERRSVKLDGLPTLDFVGHYGLASLGPSFSKASGDLGDRGRNFYSVGVELDIPVFRKQEKISLEGVEARLREARAQESLLRDQAAREVKDGWELYRLSQERSRALQEVLRLQRAKYDEEKKNFQRGRSSTDILIRFQSDLHDSESQWIQARLDEWKSRVALEFAAGRLDRVLSLGAARP